MKFLPSKAVCFKKYTAKCVVWRNPRITLQLRVERIYFCCCVKSLCVVWSRPFCGEDQWRKCHFISVNNCSSEALRMSSHLFIAQISQIDILSRFLSFFWEILNSKINNQLFLCFVFLFIWIMREVVLY